MSGTSDWANTGGDSWAQLWRQTDRALAGMEDLLVPAILKAAPSGPFRAFEIGCGAGATTADLAARRPDARIVACDVSAALADLARNRVSGFEGVRVVVGDAEALAPELGPFHLLYSRHGVMFFAEPVRAFSAFRQAAAPGAALVFSCFRDWALNPWASELASVAAGRRLPPPGREPSGFAFADPDHVEQILRGAGWDAIRREEQDFAYVAGEGEHALEEALGFLARIGPASAVLRAMEKSERPSAIARMRALLAERSTGGRVEFPAAAWIWTARAQPPA